MHSSSTLAPYYCSPFGIIPLNPEVYPDLEEAHRWMRDYFSGVNPQWLPPMRLSGTLFQMRVWQLLQLIPYGTTTTYGQLAWQISPTMSAQAVGQAVHRNPCPVVIPCHRVIGAGGSLTGYALGLPIKSSLLELERLQNFINFKTPSTSQQ